jgi:hypothetical protein
MARPVGATMIKYEAINKFYLCTGNGYNLVPNTGEHVIEQFELLKVGLVLYASADLYLRVGGLPEFIEGPSC